MLGRAIGLSAAVLLASTAVHPSTASAQGDDAARVHFQSGATYYEAAEYEDALREFQNAYELSNRPGLFYNISLCYQQLGDLEHAIEYLRRYLNEVEDVPNRGNLERRLANFEERLAAERAEDEQEQVEQQEQEQQQTQPPALHPQPPEEGPGPPVTGGPPERTTPAPVDEGGGISTLSVVGFVAAGVGVVTMATFGILALTEESSVADGCGATTSCTEDDVAPMDTFALISDVGLGIAVVGAALGVVGLVTGGGDPQTDTAAVSPWIAPEGAGASVRGAF